MPVFERLNYTEVIKETDDEYLGVMEIPHGVDITINEGEWIHIDYYETIHLRNVLNEHLRRLRKTHKYGSLAEAVKSAG